jgi:uncharacterized protein
MTQWRRLLPVSLVVSLMLATIVGRAAFAGPLEDGSAAYLNGDWAKAIRLLQPLADQGDPRAEELIGRLYERGAGFPRDFHAAVDWYRRAADKGDANAAARLGFMYRIGEGVTRDLAEAARWYRLGADKGNRLAQAGLGFLTLEGLGVPADPMAAAVLLRKAAEQGNAEAQLAMGGLYELGKGVLKDYVLADKWYSLATVDDGENDPELFDRARRAKQRLEEKMSAGDLARAQEAVRLYKPTATTTD